jgi:hypothetical protein
MHVALDDEDVAKIAHAVVELLREQREDPTPQAWMDTASAAQYAGCSPHSLRKAMAAREVRFSQDAPSRKAWFRAEWIDQWRGI